MLKQKQNKQFYQQIQIIKGTSNQQKRYDFFIRNINSLLDNDKNEECWKIRQLLHAYKLSLKSQSQQKYFYQKFKQFIEKNLDQIKCMGIFLALYQQLEFLLKQKLIFWELVYQNIRKQGGLNKMHYWFNNLIQKDIQKARNQCLPLSYSISSIIQKCSIKPSYEQFQMAILLLSVIIINTKQTYKIACKLSNLILKLPYQLENMNEQYQHKILRKIISYSKQIERKQGSLFLLCQSRQIDERTIEYFTNIYQQIILDLDETYLTNIFVSLFNFGLSRSVLQLFKKISLMLLSTEQFFILRKLYQNIVLPILAKKYKNHLFLFKQIYEIVNLYAIGLLLHCDLDKQSVNCMLYKIQNIKNQIYRQGWKMIVRLVCKQNKELIQIVKKNNIQIQINLKRQIQTYRQNKCIWDVTLRNGRKLKKYPQIISKRYKGIVNKNNQCYLISSVQAFYLTKQLSKFVQKFKQTFEFKNKKIPIIKQLWHLLIQDLIYELNSLNNITVSYLQKLSPKQFQSTSQEDAQQFLLKIFQCIQNQLNKFQSNNFIKEFYQIFRAQFASKIVCDKCKNQRNLPDLQYNFISSFSIDQTIKLSSVENLDDNYKCAKCNNQKSSKKISTISKKPKIFIAHYNRFGQTSQGKPRKLLVNKPIPRTVQDYVLTGFISHKGSNINAGHYLFYGRIDKNTWGLFNDNIVSQFNINENQQFDRQFRTQNTPYIIFYKLKSLIKQ